MSSKITKLRLNSQITNHRKLIYINQNEKTNTNNNNNIDSNFFNDNNKTHDFINSIYIKRIKDIEISKINNNFMNNNEEINNFDSMALDEYM